MKTLKLSDHLALPLAVVTEKLAWLGRTGSGKTYGAMKLAELMLGAGAQIGVIDPVGVWRGLRVPTQRGGVSFQVVVFGGLTGYDLPLEPTAGELVADLVSDRGLSFVLDVSQLVPSEQQRLVHDFAGRFFQRRKAAPAAVHLFMEECQEFLPENPSGLEARTLGVMQRLWKLGRNFGIGGSLISQRPQEIAKKALNMSGTLFAFQMTGPQERKTIRSWVADHGVATDIEAALQKLQVGQPHVESPTFLEVSQTVRILPRVTADLSSTPTVTGIASAERPLTPIDVEQLRAAMAATIEKAKADDPKALRAALAEKDQRIKELERVTTGFAPAVQTPRTVEILTDADRKTLDLLALHVREIQEGLDRFVAGQVATITGKVRALLESHAASVRDNVAAATDALAERTSRASVLKCLEKLDRVSAAPTRHDGPTRSPQALGRASTTIRLATERQATSTASRGNGHAAATAEGVTRPQRAILNALAWGESMRLPTQRREKVAFLADASPKSSAFMNNLGALRSAGLIDYPQQGYVALTAAGRAIAVVDGDAPTTSKELQAAICAKLPAPQARIVDALARTYPKALPREGLAALAGASATSSAFVNNLGALRTLGLIDYPRQGLVQATPVLFLEATA